MSKVAIMVGKASNARPSHCRRWANGGSLTWWSDMSSRGWGRVDEAAQRGRKARLGQLGVT